jgi:cell division protein FtsX
MSDKPPPIGGIAAVISAQAAAINEGLTDAFYGEEAAAHMRAAATERNAVAAEVEAKDMRRADFLARLETIQRVAITVTIVLACALALLIGFQVWLLLLEATP